MNEAKAMAEEEVTLCASHELNGALIVDPYDMERTAEAIRSLWKSL